ncbi:MAG: SGNH/GDSL hydrolase family protein, partial [Bacteroidota bacterium]|nr:SGNH/GDSL hydrolase family protein [Bacteroidota bacterium]
MMKCLVFLILLAMISPAATYSQGLQITDPIRFLALGDSYTIGQSVPVNHRWPVQLMDSLETRGYTVDTLRIIATTGWRTDNLLNAIRSQDLKDENYNLVSLLIGVNNQYQGRPFSQYTNEFPILLDSAISYAGGDPSRVFVVSIPDYVYTPFGQQSGDPGQISMELDQYNAFNQQIAADYGVTYFNITPISRLGIQHPEYVANDGLHPSGIQYTEWVQLMLELIDEQATGVYLPKSEALNVNIFPNPAWDEITLEFPLEKTTGSFRIQLYAADGMLILERTINRS